MKFAIGIGIVVSVLATLAALASYVMIAFLSLDLMAR